MKVAIASTGKVLSSDVDSRFGRAPYFIIYDTDTDQWEAIDNTSTSMAHGAGPKTAELISSKGATHLLVGHCGPNAFSSLQSAGITVITNVSGTVIEAVNKLKNGGFNSTKRPDVTGHWG